MNSSHQSTGSLVGAILGGIVGGALSWGNPAGIWAGVAAGSAIGAVETPVPPVAWITKPQPTPPGMSALLRPLLGLPFQLGAHDPQTGALDCGGLVAYALWHGLGIKLPFIGSTAIDLCLWGRKLPPVWRQRGDDRGGWLPLLQPWDVLIWYDPEVEAALAGAFDPQTLGPLGKLCHVGMAINQETVVNAALSTGVSFWEAWRLAAIFGNNVGGLLRAPGVGPWEPVRRPTPPVPGNPFELTGQAKVW